MTEKKIHKLAELRVIKEIFKEMGYNEIAKILEDFIKDYSEYYVKKGYNYD